MDSIRPNAYEASNSVSDHFHIVVVGAGPAGASAAIHFRQMNPDLDIALIDRASFPRDKACGDGLGPGVIPQLAALGIDLSEIDYANTVNVAEVHGPDGLAFRTDLSTTSDSLQHGATARRIDFDNLLLRRAQTLGVRTFEGTRFLTYAPHDETNEVHLHDVDSRRQFTLYCDLLVGADGANSRVRRAAGIRPNSPKRTSIAIRAYGDLPSDCSDRIVISFEDGIRPGYGWCFPFRDGTANVGVGMGISDYRKLRPDLKELLQHYLEVLADRHLPVTGVDNFSTYTLPHGGRLPRMTGDRVALVGDAASMINPLSGEGIVYGLKASRLLAETIASTSLDRASLQDALKRYRREFRREYAFHLKSNYIAQRLLRSRLWAKLVIGGCSIDASLRSTAVDFMFGNGRLTPGNTLRMVKYGRRYLKQS